MAIRKKINFALLMLMCLILLSACEKTDILKANTYAVVEDVSEEKLELNLGNWENSTFVSISGETAVLLQEIVSIKNMQGEIIEYNALRKGDILKVFIQTDVNTEEAKVQIQVVETRDNDFEVDSVE